MALAAAGGGWVNDYTTVTALFPSFSQVAWKTVERVIEGDGNFTVEDVRQINVLWH